MKKTKKSILSVLFALAMLVGMMPVSAFATTTPTVAPTVAPSGEAAIPTEWQAVMMFSAAKPDDKSWETFEALPSGSNAQKFIGDGVYTFSMKASDKNATASASDLQVLLIDINEFIPALDASGKNYQNYTDAGNAHDISKHFQPTDLTIGVKAYVDGKEVSLKNSKLNYGYIEDNKKPGNFRIEIFNKWGLHNASNMNDAPVVNPADFCPTDEVKLVLTIAGTGYNTDQGAKDIAAYEASFVTPTVAPAAADSATTDTTSTDTAADSSSTNWPLYGGIAAAVVVVVVVVIVVVSKKKK